MDLENYKLVYHKLNLEQSPIESNRKFGFGWSAKLLHGLSTSMLFLIIGNWADRYRPISFSCMFAIEASWCNVRQWWFVSKWIYSHILVCFILLEFLLCITKTPVVSRVCIPKPVIAKATDGERVIVVNRGCLTCLKSTVMPNPSNSSIKGTPRVFSMLPHPLVFYLLWLNPCIIHGSKRCTSIEFLALIPPLRPYSPLVLLLSEISDFALFKKQRMGKFGPYSPPCFAPFENKGGIRARNSIDKLHGLSGYLDHKTK